MEGIVPFAGLGLLLALGAIVTAVVIVMRPNSKKRSHREE